MKRHPLKTLILFVILSIGAFTSSAQKSIKSQLKTRWIAIFDTVKAYEKVDSIHFARANDEFALEWPQFVLFLEHDKRNFYRIYLKQYNGCVSVWHYQKLKLFNRDGEQFVIFRDKEIKNIRRAYRFHKHRGLVKNTRIMGDLTFWIEQLSYRGDSLKSFLLVRKW